MHIECQPTIEMGMRVDMGGGSSESNAEAWAVGERHGVPVDENDQTYHNNAKWYAENGLIVPVFTDNLGTWSCDTPFADVLQAIQEKRCTSCICARGATSKEGFALAMAGASNIIFYRTINNGAADIVTTDSILYFPSGNIAYLSDTVNVADAIDDTARAGDTHRAWSADKLTSELDLKAPKANPEFTGSISMGRLESYTTGNKSVAFGDSVEASAYAAFAEGGGTRARGMFSHSEGEATTASGEGSHAEGMGANATGSASHSEGNGTTASGNYSHAEGYQTIANHKSQHVFGELNIADDSSETEANRGNYVEIVGNGTGNNARSNARTLDWDGNEELAGDLTIKKGSADEVSVSELAEDLGDLKSAINVLTPAATSEDVGKFLKAKTVSGGKVTEYEFGSGGGGGGGTDDYSDLTNKPQINGVTLAGNKSASDIGLLAGQDVTEAVDDYLEENFSNPSNPPLDRTLSSELSAAPADMVGTLRDKSDYVVSTSYTYPGNLADTTGVVKTGQYTDYVTFDLVGNGSYYSNPFDSNFNTSDNSAQYEIKFLDSNGDEITITKNSDSSTMTTLTSSSLSKFTITINGTGLVVTLYLKNGNVYDIGYTLSATPVKIKYHTRWWDSDKAQKNGFTYGFSSATYVPYSAPVTIYSPNAEFADDVKDYYAENGFIDSTLDTSGSAADAKAVGDELYDRKSITFETEGGWIRPADGTLISSSNYTATDYIPVTPGETIRVNRPALKEITDNAYYNASKQYVSGLTTPSNQMDLIIPSGVYYVRFSDSNSGFTGFSVERAGLWTRIRDAISESSGEAEYRNLIEQSKYGSNVLTLLHFSDLHMDATTMGFINTFRTKYAEFLDDVIQTGDTSNGFSNDWTTLVSAGLGDCLGVIGNHEALGSSKNSATQQELHEKYIAPYISGWNVTQPTGVDDSTSEHYCANYYYKDYASATVRLIVLDTQKWSSAQLSWFTDVLASARTAGYAVAVASHVLPGAITITDCNFSARYSAGNNVTHAFPTDDAPLASEDAVSAVNDFITAGGEFTIWIGGHEHADIFGVFTNYPNVTAYMIDKASIERETPGAARISGEKNQHAFNVMSIVRSGKQIKFVRIGEDVDGMMRGKHVFCYNYNTKTVISQW